MVESRILFVSLQENASLLCFPTVLTYSNLLSPTSQRLAVRPFSPERETFEPLPLSIQIHSVRLRCLFSPRYLYLHQKMYIYYFLLYLAESLTGRNYTEGKLLRYFPLWRERGTIRPQADGGKQNPLCWDKGKHANVLSSFSLKGSSPASGLTSEEKLSVFRVGQPALSRQSDEPLSFISSLLFSHPPRFQWR